MAHAPYRFCLLVQEWVAGPFAPCQLNRIGRFHAKSLAWGKVRTHLGRGVVRASRVPVGVQRELARRCPSRPVGSGRALRPSAAAMDAVIASAGSPEHLPPSGGECQPPAVSCQAASCGPAVAKYVESADMSGHFQLISGQNGHLTSESGHARPISMKMRPKRQTPLLGTPD